MNRSRKRRARSEDVGRQPHREVETPRSSAATAIDVDPPAKRPWFLLSGTLAVVLWIAFLIVLAIGRA